MNKVSKFFNKFNPRLQEFKIFQNAYYWFIVPLSIIFIALVCGTIYNSSATKFDGFANVGTDFRGGTVLTVEMIGADMINVNYQDNLELISDVLEDNGTSVSTIQTSGTNAIVIRYRNYVNGENYNTADKTEDMILVNSNITRQIEAKFKDVYGQNITISADAELTNATASKELINKSILAIVITLIVMMIYIMFRFDLFSGITAVIVLINDIIMMLALVIIFNIQINSSLIAGVITIVSYSINNAIVVFDRIRENVTPYKSKKARYDVRDIVNTSVAQTFRRSLFTTLTTLITITILASVGVKALTEFALPIIFGLISGLYSSLVLAPSIWGLMMQSKIDGDKKKGKRKPQKYNRRARATR